MAVTATEFGEFKAETRSFQSGLATVVMELQDGLAEMQTGLSTAQKAVTKMAELLDDA